LPAWIQIVILLSCKLC